MQVVPVAVQGGDAPLRVARAVRALCRTDCDLIVVVRGGGSKADLASFDSEVVARAIAGATKPVWTGIGHTGDESVADIVANRACITPTECGHQIVVARRSVVGPAYRSRRYGAQSPRAFVVGGGRGTRCCSTRSV